MNQLGFNVLTENRFVNALGDFSAFMEAPSSRQVLKDIVAEGYAEKILKICKGNGDWQFPFENMKEDFIRKHAYKNDLVLYVFSCVSYGIGWTDEVLDYASESIKNDRFNLTNRIAIPDTSALLRNIQLVDKLDMDYEKVIIPDIVINELSYIKDYGKPELRKKAWEVLCAIKNSKSSVVKFMGNNKQNNDLKIISFAECTAQKHGCKVDIITEDIDYSVLLKDNQNVFALTIKEYFNKYSFLVDGNKLQQLDSYYSDSYEIICPPSVDELNAYLSNGNTLIISVVRTPKQPIEYRKNKIKWLVKNGADVDKRDSGRRNFPPISHAIQMNDFEIFKFLLTECNANPNVGSKNPQNAEGVRQKNEGNMPLMIAAWDGKEQFVNELLKDSRTSINQQDANGFTALIKACANGNTSCMQMLLNAGADTKIVDIDGKNYLDHKKRFEQNGQMRKNYKRFRK